MIGTESIKYSLRNLKQRKARSFLTIFSIFAGITTIFIFISFGYGLFNYVEEITTSSSVDKIIIQPKGFVGPGSDSALALTDDDVDAVKKASGVFDAIGISFRSAEITFKDEKEFQLIIGYDPKKPMLMELYDLGVEKGRNLRPGDTRQVVLGYNYQVPGKIFSKAIEVNQKIEINGRELKVVGFYESVGSAPDDAQIYISSDYMEELYPDEEISYYWVMARVDIEKMDIAIENVEKNLRKERGLEKGKEDFFVQSYEDMMDSYMSVLNIIIGFVILIALISVVVSAVNTANTMITSVLERYKEIGVLKAIGARNTEVFGIFLFESSFLGFVAGVIGVLLGWGLSYLGGVILANLGWGFLQPYFSIELFVACVLFAVATGAISGVIPAIKASKTNTVDALRYE